MLGRHRRHCQHSEEQLSISQQERDKTDVCGIDRQTVAIGGGGESTNLVFVGGS